MFFDLQEENVRKCNIRKQNTQQEKVRAYTAICGA